MILIAWALHVTFLLTNIFSFAGGGRSVKISIQFSKVLFWQLWAVIASFSCNGVFTWFCLSFLNGWSHGNQIALILKIFRCRLICFFIKSCLVFHKWRYLKKRCLWFLWFIILNVFYQFWKWKFCLPFRNGLNYRDQIELILKIFWCILFCFFRKIIKLF